MSVTPKRNVEFQPATALWNLYDPVHAPHAFRAIDRDAALAWQRATREAFGATLGFLDTPRVDPAPQVVERVDKGDYVREKVVISTAPHTSMPVYLLLPKTGAGPRATVVAFHGHGYGVKDIVGLWENGTERDEPDGYHRDFGVALCRQGFAVAAPEISCFGERRTDYSYLRTDIGSPVPTTCEQSAALATHLGGSVAGLRVRDALRLIDYLETRPEFDMQALGAMGISGGGMHALFSSCIDVRFRAVVVSGYFSTFRGSVLAMHHCPCNFVHGLGAFGEMADLAGLVAPRPMLVEAGDHDPIFPLAAVHEGVANARRVYGVFGVDDRLEEAIFTGRHRIDGACAYPFLRRELGVE